MDRAVDRRPAAHLPSETDVPGETALPGATLVESGLRDLRQHLETVPALLVSIGAPRLRELGLDVPSAIADPEHRLYERLRQDDEDAAHARYNALVRRLVSFERALAGVR